MEKGVSVTDGLVVGLVTAEKPLPLLAKASDGFREAAVAAGETRLGLLFPATCCSSRGEATLILLEAGGKREAADPFERV